jgi:bacteriocin-like protein
MSLKGAIMRDQKQQEQSTGIPQEKKKGTTELSDEELKKVSGGKVSHQDLSISKYLDKASPKL